MAHRVLVVDDDPDLLDMITDVLKSFSRTLTVTQAADGQSAIEAIAREAFDLVLLDVRMPVMAGFEALKRIKSLAPRVPVLRVTGGDGESASEAMRMGAFGYLPKPMDLRYVEHIVSLALGETGAHAHA